jgi:hypothetical protein
MTIVSLRLFCVHGYKNHVKKCRQEESRELVLMFSVNWIEWEHSYVLFAFHYSFEPLKLSKSYFKSQSYPEQNTTPLFILRTLQNIERDIVVGVVNRLKDGELKNHGSIPAKGHQIFPFFRASRLDLVSIQTFI